jgi:hypothetical protein
VVAGSLSQAGQDGGVLGYPLDIFSSNVGALTMQAPKIGTWEHLPQKSCLVWINEIPKSFKINRLGVTAEIVEAGNDGGVLVRYAKKVERDHQCR